MAPNRTTRIAKSLVTITLFCVLVVSIGIGVIGNNATLAQDRSTSITCTGNGPCEKTECVNGDCETTTTNSSNISTTQGPSAEKKADERKSIIEERLSLREGR